MAKIHEKYLRSLFSSPSDVYTGSELKHKLCEEFSELTPENARKIIQIAAEKKIMLSTKPIQFGHKQYVYFTPGTQLDHEAIRQILAQNKSIIKRVIDLLNEKKAISTLDIYKLAATPIGETTSKVTTIEQVTDFLTHTDIAVQTYVNGVRYLVHKNLMPDGVYTASALQAIQERDEEIRLDALFIPVIINWLRKHNMVTNQNVQYRSKTHPHTSVNYNGIAWDAILHTKSTGYYDISAAESADSHTCVAIDVKISSSYTKHDLDGFYDRIQRFRLSVKKMKKRRILPIIVCEGFDSSIKAQIKNLNIICFEIGTLFGNRIHEIISALKDVDLTHTDPESGLYKINGALQALEESGQQDNLGQLKGALFERMFYPVFQKILRPISIKYGVIYNNIEYDYVIETDDEYIIVELKGYRGHTLIKKGAFDEKTQKQIPYTVNWFLKHTFPSIKKKYEPNPDNKPVRACYITSAMFEQAALDVWEEVNRGKLKPAKLDVFYDGKKLIQLLKDHQLKTEEDIVMKFYKPMIHPEAIPAKRSKN